jgi:hypothetical protein
MERVKHGERGTTGRITILEMVTWAAAVGFVALLATGALNTMVPWR